MRPDLTPPKVPIALRPDHVATQQTTIRVQQQGKGLSSGKFTVFTQPSTPEENGSSSNKTKEEPEVLFTVDGKYVSMKRHFYDASGLPLFVLRRHMMGNKWEVELPGSAKDGDDESIATIQARFSTLKDNLDMTFVNAADGGGAGQDISLHIQGQDIWKQRTNILLGDRVVITAKRTDKFNTYIPGVKIEWDVTIAEGIDISLASLIVVLLGCNMYESQVTAVC